MYKLRIDKCDGSRHVYNNVMALYLGDSEYGVDLDCMHEAELKKPLKALLRIKDSEYVEQENVIGFIKMQG